MPDIKQHFPTNTGLSKSFLPTLDVQEVNRSTSGLKRVWGGGGVGVLVTGFGQNELSRVAHDNDDNFHRVLSFDPIECSWVSEDKVCGDGKGKCLPLRERWGC